jgi:hypothetical protein
MFCWMEGDRGAATFCLKMLKSFISSCPINWSASLLIIKGDSVYPNQSSVGRWLTTSEGVAVKNGVVESPLMSCIWSMRRASSNIGSSDFSWAVGGELCPRYNRLSLTKAQTPLVLWVRVCTPPSLWPFWRLCFASLTENGSCLGRRDGHSVDMWPKQRHRQHLVELWQDATLWSLARQLKQSPFIFLKKCWGVLGWVVHLQSAWGRRSGGSLAQGLSPTVVCQLPWSPALLTLFVTVPRGFFSMVPPHVLVKYNRHASSPPSPLNLQWAN